jgi:putative Holliday junction resolvase
MRQHRAPAGEEAAESDASSQIPSRVNRSTLSIVVSNFCTSGYHESVPGVPLSRRLQPWLGLDVGTRRIGVALSNALGIAQPLLTIERTQPRRDQRSILRLARRHGCAGIVTGNPLQLSGDPSPQTERVHRFVDELKTLIVESSRTQQNAPGMDHLSLTVHLWDERLSTVEAHAALEATGHNPADRRIRRHVVDQVAAALILQGWLDAQSGSITLLPPGS